MNKQQSNEDVWQEWLDEAASAEPSRDFWPAVEGSLFVKSESRKTSAWRLMQRGFEHRWGRIAMCLAALVAGSIPYLFALSLLRLF